MRSKKKNTTSIPRPPNPFILYRKDKWHIIKNDPRHADLRQADLSKFLGDAWRAESEDVKLEYQRRAAECKAEHTRLYPDYKYAPQPKRKRAKRTRKEEDESRYDWGFPEAAFGEDPSQASEPAGTSISSKPRARPRPRTTAKAIATPLLFTQRVARRLNETRKRDSPLALGLELSPEGRQAPPPLARMSRATHPTTPSTPTPMFDAYSHLPQHSSRLNDSVSVLGPAEPTLSPTSIDTFSFHWFDNINAPFSTAADLDTTPWPSDPASQHQPSTLPSIPSTHSCATGDGFDILWGPPEWSAFDLPTRASAPSQRVPVPFPLNDTTWDENSNPHSSTSRWNDQAATTSATTSREEPRALLTTSAPLRNQPAHNLRGTPVAAPLSVVTNTYDSWPAPSEPEDGWCLRDAGGLYATIEEIERWSELES